MKSEVRLILRECLGEAGCSSPIAKMVSCSEVRDSYYLREGVYVYLTKDGDPLYAGQTHSLKERVGLTHCDARIGASEGVVRMLFFILERICDKILSERSIIARERIARIELKKFIENELILYVGFCDKERLRRNQLLLAEQCVISSLKPILNVGERLFE